MPRLFLLALLFLLKLSPVSAQWAFGVKFMGISYHPGKNANLQYYDIPLSKHKRVVLNIGLAFTAEYMFYGNFSVKAEQALFRDCAGKLAGMSMLNIRYTADLGKAGNASGGIGPFFYYRKTWTNFEGYNDEGYFRLSHNRKWQTKFVWYGGELEYNYPINERFDISANIFPGIPVVYVFSPGIRYRPSPR